jgi:hypothetical protein
MWYRGKSRMVEYYWEGRRDLIMTRTLVPDFIEDGSGRDQVLVCLPAKYSNKQLDPVLYKRTHIVVAATQVLHQVQPVSATDSHSDSAVD